MAGNVPSDVVLSHGGLQILEPFLVYDLVPRVDDAEEQTGRGNSTHTGRAAAAVYYVSFPQARNDTMPPVHPRLLFTRDWATSTIGLAFAFWNIPGVASLTFGLGCKRDGPTDVLWATIILSTLCVEDMLVNMDRLKVCRPRAAGVVGKYSVTAW